MFEFKNVSILLPALNETFSFIKTVEIILQECSHQDIGEMIAIVCERTETKSLAAIEEAKKKAEHHGIPFYILYQALPFAGGAIQDGIMKAASTHVLMMSSDLETDPHSVKDFIAMGKNIRMI